MYVCVRSPVGTVTSVNGGSFPLFIPTSIITDRLLPSRIWFGKLGNSSSILSSALVQIGIYPPKPLEELHTSFNAVPYELLAAFRCGTCRV